MDRCNENCIDIASHRYFEKKSLQNVACAQTEQTAVARFHSIHISREFNVSKLLINRFNGA